MQIACEGRHLVQIMALHSLAKHSFDEGIYTLWQKENSISCFCTSILFFFSKYVVLKVQIRIYNPKKKKKTEN